MAQAQGVQNPMRIRGHEADGSSLMGTLIVIRVSV